MLPHDRALESLQGFNARGYGITVLLLCLLSAARWLLDLLSHSHFKLVKKHLKTIVGIKVFIRFAVRVTGCPRSKVSFI